MNIAVDRETKITGFGRTPEEAFASMRFNVERSGRLSEERLERRKEIHAWLPKDNLLHVSGIGAILYEKGQFKNLVTGRTVKVLTKPLAHYLYLYSAFDGLISYEDFTITIAPEVNRFLSNISDRFLTLNDFPYISPVDSFVTRAYHQTNIADLTIVETVNDTIVILNGVNTGYEVNKSVGISSDCLLAYLFASQGYTYDGVELKRVLHED